MRPHSNPRRVLGVLVLLLASIGCASEVVSQEPGSSSPGDPEVLAVIDGVSISVADLEELIGNDLATLEYTFGSQRYQLLQAGLDQIVRQRLIDAAAEDEGVTVDEFVAARLEGRVSVSDQDVEGWYAANQQRLQGRSLDQLRSAIQQFLAEQQRETILTELTDELRGDRDVAIHLEPFRAALDLDGHPSIGPENAPITLVEFSDFECPYCGSFFATIERVKEEYAGKIRLVYRQFPLRQIHPNAQKAAEASLCAGEQDSFWELHDLMFEEQHALDVAELKEKAGRLGLDEPAFAACLDSGKHFDAVEADLQAGARMGISGTPALFVNGRPVDGGAVGFEVIAAVIDDELARAAR